MNQVKLPVAFLLIVVFIATGYAKPQYGTALSSTLGQTWNRLARYGEAGYPNNELRNSQILNNPGRAYNRRSGHFSRIGSRFRSPLNQRLSRVGYGSQYGHDARYNGFAGSLAPYGVGFNGYGGFSSYGSDSRGFGTFPYSSQHSRYGPFSPYRQGFNGYRSGFPSYGSFNNFRNNHGYGGNAPARRGGSYIRRSY